MATKKKLLQAAAGSAGGAGGLNVEDVFSTYLYEGNGDKQFIDNGINLGQANDGYSGYFGGAGYYVGAEQTTLTDFTVEGWIYFDNLAINRTFFTLGYSDLQLYYRSTSSNVAIYDTSAKTYSFTPSAATWYHFALVRSGTNVELFINGVSQGTQTSSATISGDTIIGGYAGATDEMNGYISNFRISDNVRYSSNFTAPTSALTTDANTTLLTLQDSTFIDNSGNGNVITPNGGAEMVSHTPFTAADAGEGGLVWIKGRTGTPDHALYDTERGANSLRLSSSTTNAAVTLSGYDFSSFNSNGFTVKNDALYNYTNDNRPYASWTFRKAPKFFDVVTYTGTGVARTVSHNLDSEVGSIFIKRTDTTQNWAVYHRGANGGTNPEDYYFRLNQDIAQVNDTNQFNSTPPTSTEFYLGTDGDTNASGSTYVAYLFAHNDGDGDFGPTGDQDVIKCGSYTGNGSSTGPEIDLGFEPQWIMVKRTDSTSPWTMWDVMRGLANNGTSDDRRLKADTSDAESNSPFGHPTSTGFTITGTNGDYNASGGPYIYIAIRRGPMAVPTDATEVFKTVVPTANQADSPTPYWNSGFAVDMALHRHNAGSSGISHLAFDRLRGDSVALATDQTTDESSAPHSMFISGLELDHSEGVHSTVGYGAGSGSEDILHMWQRRPNYFDVVAYTGNGTAGRTVSHNLGVAPEMMWVKLRDGTLDWAVYHKDLYNGRLWLNDTNAYTASSMWNNTLAGADSFTVGSTSNTNLSGRPFIAYLFASLDGVSKVGSFTHTYLTDTAVDCGFSSGARFVLIKRTDASGDWRVYDSVRGITAGADPELKLNTTDAEYASGDYLVPNSSGFTVEGDNYNSGTYIFYAIA